MTRAPRLMAIEDTASLATLGDRIRLMLDAGVDAVQVRDKSASDRELYEACLDARDQLPSEIGLFVNRRPDVAVAVGAAGVHLPANGLPTAQVRRVFGDRLVIGRSTHSIDEVRRAKVRGTDYALFGPVYPTPEKLRYGPPQGLEALRQAAGCGIPVLAVGGIDRSRIREALSCGAHGAAAIRLFQDQARLAELAATETQAHV